jgi:hypothetical protein
MLDEWDEVIVQPTSNPPTAVYLKHSRGHCIACGGCSTVGSDKGLEHGESIDVKRANLEGFDQANFIREIEPSVKLPHLCLLRIRGRRPTTDNKTEAI